MKQFSFILILIIFFTACKNPNNSGATTPPQTNDSLADYSIAMSGTDTYVKAALEICECMRPMIEKVDEIKSLQGNNNSKTIAQKENELKEIRLQIDARSTEIRNKYSDMDTPSEKKKLLAALKQYCPDSYKMID